MKKGIIVVCTLILIVVIVMVAFLMNRIALEEKEKINIYKQIVADYLKDKYNEEFEINFVRKGYKKEKYRPFILIRERSIKNIREYIYEFSKQEEYSKLSCHVAFWYNTDFDTYEIDPYIKNKSSYEEIAEDYNKKVEIADALENSVKNVFGNDYTIEMNILKYDSDFSRIDISTMNSFVSLLELDFEKTKNMYDEIKNLIKDKNLEVYVRGNDGSFFIDKDSIFENDDTINALRNVKEREEVKDSIIKCIDKYYKNQYSIQMEDYTNYISVTFDNSLFKMGKEPEKITNMYNDIVNILHDTDIIVLLDSKEDFSNLRITGMSSSETDFSLEHVINYYKNT